MWEAPRRIPGSSTSEQEETQHKKLTIRLPYTHKQTVQRKFEEVRVRIAVTASFWKESARSE
jgi:hypothetical protein